MRKSHFVKVLFSESLLFTVSLCLFRVVSDLFVFIERLLHIMSIDQVLGEDGRSQLSAAQPATTVPIIIQEDAMLTKKKNKRSPQQTVDDFWDKFIAKHPGKVHTVLPHDVYAKSKAAHGPKGIARGQATHKLYEQAVAACRAAVDKIAKECRRVNMRYRDPHFDIEFDLKRNKNECLEGLTATDDPPFKPGSVKRVPVGYHR